MSQRPPASRPASRSPPDGQGITLPSVQVRDDGQQFGGQAEGQRSQAENRGFQQQVQISPQHPRTSHPPPPGEDWRSSGPSRDLGVHSILNPTEPDGNRSKARRPSGTVLDSPQSTAGPPSQFGASPSTSTPHTFAGPQPSSSTPPTAEGYTTGYSQPRRILTPRSPSRTVSSGRGRGRGTIDAHRSPFLPSRGRAYTMETGPSEIPPVPTHQTQTQQQYGYPPPSSTPAVDRRTSMPSMHAPPSAPLSQSASPSISASSQNPSSAQTSPASFLFHKGGHAPQTSSSYFPGQTFGTSMQQAAGGGGMQGMQYQGPSGATEGPYSAPAPQSQGGGSSLHSNSAGSSRQTSASDPIQVLTITTSSGQYQVPVDVHQASRLADEKRARNAGASARFRQRRKEKEREASTNIEKLQQQTRELERRVREVEQERDFYRGERDRFRDVVFRTPGMRDVAMQAPPSPLSMRPGSSFQGPGQQLGGPPPPAGYGPQPSGSMVERAPRRRRIDTQGEFASLPYSIPPASTLPPVQATGYPPALGQGPQNLPPLRMENPASTQSAASTQPPATSGPPPFDPYPRPPYERGWPGDSSRR
ncbi:hypothetical protein G7Y89_g12097 [Cudoniella acicularis]|uniref:BZIP domain-containing protein n=1 Tax=Cudoniella acicularis TaxID=354080 RepID=A0A8H4R9I7_9HELO|nr:hypothetical protein G7Y89_g12097 [Cudoniella acicularis]